MAVIRICDLCKKNKRDQVLKYRLKRTWRDFYDKRTRRYEVCDDCWSKLEDVFQGTKTGTGTYW